MVHSQHTVERFIHSVTEEGVGRVRTKGLNTFCFQISNGGDDDLLLLLSCRSLLCVTGVQGEDGNTWVGDDEITLQGIKQHPGFLYHRLLGDGASNILNRQGTGGHGYAKVFVH